MSVLEKRFWSKVNIKGTAECWNWLAGRHGHENPAFRYGAFWLNGRIERAHRIAYELFFGPISRDIQVLHGCDNPSCVNPHHLFLGTQRDNVRDAIEKGRKKDFGVDNPSSKLSPILAHQIRELYKTGKLSQSEIGKQFGIGQAAVSCVVRGVRWQSED